MSKKWIICEHIFYYFLGNKKYPRIYILPQSLNFLHGYIRHIVTLRNTDDMYVAWTYDTVCVWNKGSWGSVDLQNLSVNFFWKAWSRFFWFLLTIECDPTSDFNLQLLIKCTWGEAGNGHRNHLQTFDSLTFYFLRITTFLWRRLDFQNEKVEVFNKSYGHDSYLVWLDNIPECISNTNMKV